MILNMVVENERLPSIVQEFLSRSDILRKLISKAILDITDDIKKMVYDRESKSNITLLPKLFQAF